MLRRAMLQGRARRTLPSTLPGRYRGAFSWATFHPARAVPTRRQGSFWWANLHPRGRARRRATCAALALASGPFHGRVPGTIVSLRDLYTRTYSRCFFVFTDAACSCDKGDCAVVSSLASTVVTRVRRRTADRLVSPVPARLGSTSSTPGGAVCSEEAAHMQTMREAPSSGT
jgi:hypothetical protein